MITRTTLTLAATLAALGPATAMADGYAGGYGHDPAPRINAHIHHGFPAPHYGGFAADGAAGRYHYPVPHHVPIPAAPAYHAPAHPAPGYARPHGAYPSRPCAARTAYDPGAHGRPQITRVTYHCGSSIVSRSTIVPPVTARARDAGPVSYGYLTGPAARAGMPPQAAAMNAAPLHEVGPPVFFDAGSVMLNDAARSALRTLALELAPFKDDPEARFVVSGFTDTAGDAEANRRISGRRAAAVIAFLTEELDFPAGRFTIHAAGEDEARLSPDPGSDFHRRATVAVRGSATAGLEDPKSRAPAPHAPQTARGPAGDPACTLPGSPYGTRQIAGRVVAVSFDDLDDYGGGRLVTHCDFGG